MLVVLVKAQTDTQTRKDIPSNYTTIPQHYQPFWIVDTELKTFLAFDETDKHTWKQDKYMCEQFTQDMITNAARYNIQGNKSILWYDQERTQGHVVVCFTRGNNQYYVEPQTDLFIEPRINAYYFGQQIHSIEVQ